MRLEDILNPIRETDRSFPDSQPDDREVSGDVVFECYENRIPAFIESHLNRLYRSIFSSLPQYRIHGGAGNVSTYVARIGGEIVSVLLFRRQQRRIVVINECITLARQEVERFAHYIFRRFRDADCISFHVIDITARKMPFPFQKYACTEDIILSLPATAEEYHSSLGKSTRSYINRYLNRLRRSHPTFTFEVLEGDLIREDDVVRLFRMNQARMQERDIVYGYSEDYPARATRLLRETGMLVLTRISNEICAGAILYRIADEYYLDLISHKSEYNEHRLGTLCCYLSICECIRRGAKVYHFLWGRFEYKFRLGGTIREMSDLVVYRSYLRLLLHAGSALRFAARGNLYRARSWMNSGALTGNPLARLTFKAWHRITDS